MNIREESDGSTMRGWKQLLAVFIAGIQITGAVPMSGIVKKVYAEEIQREMEETQIKPEESQAEAGRLQAELEELQAEAGGLQAKSEELQTEAGEMQAKPGELQTEVGELQAELEELQAEAGELQAEPEDSQAEAGELQAESEELKAKGEIQAQDGVLNEAMALEESGYFENLSGESEEMEESILMLQSMVI